MTVHKGLCELKILDARITKELSTTKFVVNNKHSNQMIDGMAIAQFCQANQKKYQSVRTLINRRNAIKRAITMSNATTTVQIGDKTYTVAEAIDMKSVGMHYYKYILTQIEEEYSAATRKATKENGAPLETKADTYMTSMYSSTDLKNMSDEIKRVRDAFIASQTLDVICTIDALDVMDELRNFIDGFMADVDSALSVSNALTTIDVEYETC